MHFIFFPLFLDTFIVADSGTSATVFPPAVILHKAQYNKMFARKLFIFPIKQKIPWISPKDSSKSLYFQRFCG
jgi:hypothetical protein